MSKFILGLTGGIGSGKSAVSEMFEQKGIEVVDADLVARDVVKPGTNALTEIAQHFGTNILDETGNLRRGVLRDIIFSNPAEKTWLENLLHPLIRQEILQRLEAAPSSYAILSSPLLLETDQHKLVNRILVIDAPESLQLARASQRDQSSEDKIKAIMNTQLSRQQRCALANDIIQNNDSLENLQQQVDHYHQLYLQLI